MNNVILFELASAISRGDIRFHNVNRFNVLQIFEDQPWQKLEKIPANRTLSNAFKHMLGDPSWSCLKTSFKALACYKEEGQIIHFFTPLSRGRAAYPGVEKFVELLNNHLGSGQAAVKLDTCPMSGNDIIAIPPKAYTDLLELRGIAPEKPAYTALTLVR